MIWRGLIPPAVMPLVISVAVALAGPGGLLGITSNHSTDHGWAVANVDEPGHGSGGGGGGLGTTTTPTPLPVIQQTPIGTTMLPTPAPVLATSVPTPATPVPTLPPPPPPATPTPPPGATSTPTPPLGPVISADEACARVRTYMQQEMTTISVVFDWCSASWLGSAWGVTWEIRNPLCASFDALGLPCPHLPVQANFYHYDLINKTVAADEATEVLLLTY